MHMKRGGIRLIYQSLYRKYRPSNFAEVYGQTVAKKILMNSLKKQKISHAYLFFGPRGTGKTSIAKMFARICNCLDIQQGECCEKCDACIISKEKNCVDIVEIDAASNNGVDEIRELKSKINLIPGSLKYKVYIIDEVHMLSTGAFNALLKTLEEPPEHVIFILATTEYYKVPATIISRCQTIEFSNIDNLSMKKRLFEICQKEKIKIDDAAIDEIIRNSNGGLRDAIGLLDKAISFIEANETITLLLIRNLLGNIPLEDIDVLIERIEQKNTEEILKSITKYSEQGVDLIKILDDLIIKMKEKMIANKKYELLEMINLINDYQIKMKYSNHKDILLQMLIVELTCKTIVREKETSATEIKNESSEKNINKASKRSNEIIEIRVNNCFVNANKMILNEIKSIWKNLEKFTFDPEYGSFICDLLDCVPIVASDTNIMLCSDYLSMVNKINQNVEEYEGILKEKLTLSQKIVVVERQNWQKIKEKYLNNIKNNIKYEYIDEEKKTSNENSAEIKKTSTKERALELFGKID